tara:strand:+ start:189 stop:1313 length:1125 start_codon:yes stop_codon:yes gene_type:complete
MKIPKKLSKKIPKKIIEDFKKEVGNVPESKLKKLFVDLEKSYDDSKVEPGESVGLISAESLGEPGTQMTLDTKHFAGFSEMDLSSGLPRVIEVLDGRKTIKTPSMEIYLKSPYNKGKDVKKLALSIKELKLEDVSSEFLISVVDSVIEVILNPAKLKEFHLKSSDVEKTIKKSTKGIVVQLKDDKLILKIKTKDESLNFIYKIKEKLKKTYISGIKGIRQVLPVKVDGEFVIKTSGINLAGVLQLKFVDTERTYSNDLYEVAEVLGVEAVRQLIITEASKVFESQGISVNVRHFMLVADTMTHSGKVKGITRYGIVSEKASVLARASFETPIKHIIEASLLGEKDKLNSVIENVMLNQPVPVGTGLPGLVTKIK